MSNIATSVDEVQQVLISAIGRETGVPPDELAVQLTFGELGVDSMMALIIGADLEDAFGLVDLPFALLWEYPTIEAIAPALLDLLREQATAVQNGTEHN